MAERYAITDLDQAMRYLADPILGSRLRQDVRLMTRHKDKSALESLGSPDDLKFRSCLPLFSQAASDELRIARCSWKLWNNSMLASQTLARWSYYALELDRN